MKKIKNVNMVAIATVLMTMFSSYNSPCPAVDPLGHTVLLPSECCNWYFSCNNGVPIPIPCPDGLHFNDRLDVCDWPQNVNCPGIECDSQPLMPSVLECPAMGINCGRCHQPNKTGGGCYFTGNTNHSCGNCP